MPFTEEDKIFLATLVKETVKTVVPSAINALLKEQGIKPKTRKAKINIHHAHMLIGIAMATIKKAVNEGKIAGDKVGSRWQVDRESFERHFNLN